MDEKTAQKLLTQFSTPFYVFEADVLADRMAVLRDGLAGKAGLCYAVKANPFLTAELADTADRFEVCSPGEYYICKAEGIAKEKLVISGVNKDDNFIEMLVKEDAAGYYTAESERQYALLRRCADRYAKPIRVLLRLSSANQFGMDRETVTRLIREREENQYLSIVGIQYFSGTQKQAVKRLRKELMMLDDFLAQLRDECGYTAEELEYGAGLAVSYFEGDTLDEDVLLRDFAAVLGEMRCGAQITIELGRSIAAGCGSYFTKIVDAKRTGDSCYAIVDGGLHQIAWYGHSLAMRTPVHFPVLSDGQGMRGDWCVCGSLCSVNDILIRRLPDCELKVGDAIVFEKAGAYCVTEGISLFLSRDLPRVILLDRTGSAQTLRAPVDTYPYNFNAKGSE